MSSSNPRPGPSVRTLAITSAVVLGMLVLLTIGALTWMSSQLRRTTDAVIRDSRSMTIASEIELALLREQYLGNLFVTTHDSAFRLQREAERSHVASLLQAARRHIWSESHRGLPILRAEYGEDAGLVGAALHALERLEG